MQSRVFTDMMGRKVHVAYSPRRIVSVVPSQTELLFDLGLDEEVVGITKFCIHPDSWFWSKQRVGGTKQLHIEAIKTLNPDLVIANKEENEKVQIEELSQYFPVWISDIKTLDDACSMIQQVGELTDREQKAQEITGKILDGFARLQKSNTLRKVAYFIWRKPWMCAGGDTFISHILEKAGWVNVLADTARYPEITLDALATRQPEVILLSSEPYPFKEKHIEELKEIMPGAQTLLVDGELFSWYGSRLLHAPEYINGLIKTLQDHK